MAPGKVPGKQPKSSLKTHPKHAKQLFVGCSGWRSGCFWLFPRHFTQGPLGIFFNCMGYVLGSQLQKLGLGLLAFRGREVDLAWTLLLDQCPRCRLTRSWAKRRSVLTAREDKSNRTVCERRPRRRKDRSCCDPSQNRPRDWWKQW